MRGDHLSTCEGACKAVFSSTRKSASDSPHSLLDSVTEVDHTTELKERRRRKRRERGERREGKIREKRRRDEKWGERKRRAKKIKRSEE